MNRAKILAVKSQCHRVLELCDDVLARAERDHADDNDHYRSLGVDTLPDDGRVRGSRESGALRRASMDLTRALADLRRAD